MPMQLSHCSTLDMLLGGCNIVTLRQVLNDLLADPASVEDAGLRIRESPFQVRHHAAVSGLPAEIVWVLSVNCIVGAACDILLVGFGIEKVSSMSLTQDRGTFAIGIDGLSNIELGVSLRHLGRGTRDGHEANESCHGGLK